MCIETLYQKGLVGSALNLQEGKKQNQSQTNKKTNKQGVPGGHVKIKRKDGTIILTAGGISKLLIKRLTMKNMKTQVSRGLLILCWYSEEIWLYGTIFKSHFIALKTKTTKEAPEPHGHPWGDRGKNHCVPGFPIVHHAELRTLWTKDDSWWELGDKIQHAHARPTTTSGDLLP